MVTKNKAPKFLQRFIINRKGTAEVIGSVLFVIIVLFFFSNVYLWHDSATKTMNNVLSDKLNSAIEVNWLTDENGVEQNILLVTNTGGVGTSLSRLWIITSNNPSAQHLYASLENLGGKGLYVAAGNTVTIELSGGPIPPNSEIIPTSTSTGAKVPYTRIKAEGETFTVLTSLGNMASPQGTIKIVTPIIVNNEDDGGNTNSPVGSVIVANFSTFNYYKVSGSSLGSPQSGYNVDSNGANVAFSVVLTNMDDHHRTVSLSSNSQMFFINTKNPNNVGYLIFYTVKLDANGNILPTYSSVNLEYGVPTTVYFASAGSSIYTAKNLVTSGNKADSGVYPLNLALLGSYSDGTPLGQNIPFVSIFIKS